MTTVPAGLFVIVTYGTGATAPVNVGTYAVEALVADPNFVGSALGTMTIAPAMTSGQAATVNVVAGSEMGVHGKKPPAGDHRRPVGQEDDDQIAQHGDQV